MTTTTYCTFPDLLTDGGRLAPTVWEGGATHAEALAATLSLDAEAIVLRIVRGSEVVRGLAPGGLG